MLLTEFVFAQLSVTYIRVNSAGNSDSHLNLKIIKIIPINNVEKGAFVRTWQNIIFLNTKTNQTDTI